ncbi:hypothetical protein lbkm_3239 [Lachnospiraceae bacterium KM106-2]|nr:hypothetical protein lbkm_3239 [Lachnospiraceae bacterium KM106-2]
MTKDVLISISGLQFEINEDEAIEVISVGDYHYRNEKHYILYEDVVPDENGKDELTKNMIKVGNNIVEITKKGANNVHMVFELGKKNMTLYNTPIGALMIGLNTTSLVVKESEEELLINIEYSLDINYSHVSDCAITIKVKNR